MDDSYYYYLYIRYMLGAFIPWIILIVVGCVGMWKIFKKANRPAWAAIIPFYNIYMTYDIVWGNGIKFLLLCIPIYNIILAVQTNIRLAKAFGKGTGFGIGLTVLSPVFLLILGFGKSEFVGLNNDTSHTAKRPVIEQNIQPTEIPQKTAMFCGQCGAKLGNGNFCPKCGSPVKK